MKTQEGVDPNTCIYGRADREASVRLTSKYLHISSFLELGLSI